MSKELPEIIREPLSGESSSPSVHPKAIRDFNEVRSAGHAGYKYPTKIQNIADALIAEGYLSLDAQAKALGVCRSTAWTIVKTKHKLDRLSFKTTNSMLANPELPRSVRLVICQYLSERSEWFAQCSKRRRNSAGTKSVSSL
jgi:hypothetical protein